MHRVGDQSHLCRSADLQPCTPISSYAPMTLAAHLPTSPEVSRRYGQRDYVDLGVQWDASGRLLATVRDSAHDITPAGTTLASNSIPPTPASQHDSSFSRQHSGLSAKDLTTGRDDSSHFKRPLSPVPGSEATEYLPGTDEVDDAQHALKPYHGT